MVPVASYVSSSAHTVTHQKPSHAQFLIVFHMSRFTVYLNLGHMASSVSEPWIIRAPNISLLGSIHISLKMFIPVMPFYLGDFNLKPEDS